VEESLEERIEKLKLRMYEAYKDVNNYDAVLEISQELDKLLNQFHANNRQKLWTKK